MRRRGATLAVIAPMLVCWIAVGGVLVYNRSVLQANPRLTRPQRDRQQEELELLGGTVLLFNTVATVLRARGLNRLQGDADAPPATAAALRSRFR